MKHRNSARWAVLAAAALGIASLTASPSGAADPSPAQPGPVSKGIDLKQLSPETRAKIQQRLNDPNARLFPSKRTPDLGRTAYFVRFNGEGAADAAARAGGGSRGVTAAKSRRAEVSRLASGVLGAARKVDSKAAAIYTVANAIPGTALMLDAAGVKAVAANPNVADVSRLVAKTAEMKSTTALVKAVNAWKSAGNTGKGVTIGIVDTGIDYTHADFGGVGTVAAYAAADASDTLPTWHQNLPNKAKKKFAGGYDFAGDNYNGDPEPGDGTSPIPQPDNNPLDCNGHGSHVAGTAAGYGVSASGKTLKAKKYKKLNKKKLMKLDIGPGVAPMAQLYGLRVFGCEGSTYLAAAAYDRALDPDGDGDFSDHLDVINASLGSTYGPQDDPENAIINEIAAHGVVPALSIGNDNDVTSIGGASGNATAAIASASTVDKLDLFDALRVNAPANLAGNKPGQVSIAYDWATKPDVTGQVIDLPASNEDGCEPPAADPDNPLPADPASWSGVAGKVVWMEWDDNDSTRRCGSVVRSQNAQDAGAIGAIFTSQLEFFSAGITGDADIPVFQLRKSAADQLRPAAQAGTLNVTFDGDLLASFETVTPSRTDTVSTFSSRGPHGSRGVVKPDVAAPGDSISSAGVGTGNKVLNISGTSMASPHTAGVAALVLSEHPKWAPLKVKTAIMNTARHDVFTGLNRTGHRYGPARVGAGRIDAKAAIGTKILAWATGPNMPVSASFGVVEAPINGGTFTRSQTIKVKNLNKKDVKVKVSYESLVSQPGATYSVSKKKLKLKAGKTKEFKVTLTVNPAQLRHTIDPTMETQQLGLPRQYVSDSSGRLLIKQKGKKPNRVPVFAATKPTSATTTALSGNNLVVSGQGFNTGTSSTDWRSWLNVSEFGGTDAPMGPCPNPDDFPEECYIVPSDRASDVQHFGAGSNADFLWFSQSTYDDWVNLGSVNSPDVLVDTDGNLTNGAEFNVFVAELEDFTDLPVAITIDFVDDEAEAWPVNFNLGNVDTNVFDNNVVVLPVDRAFVDLDGAGDHPVTYSSSNYSNWYGDYVDFGALTDWEAGTPNVTTADELYPDTGGTTIPLTGDRDENSSALVLHLHGRKGNRTEIIPVPAVP